jgi:hypothetical protein
MIWFASPYRLDEEIAANVSAFSAGSGMAHEQARAVRTGTSSGITSTQTMAATHTLHPSVSLALRLPSGAGL